MKAVWQGTVVAENPPGGTVVTVTVPYKTVEGTVA